MKKLSVIVPVYNGEKYLRMCVESILAQTYSNLEVVVIDDGSADRSFEIAREMKNKDDRIMVVSQKNSGVSAARNKGLETVSGEYIAFVDSDDFIEPDMYEKMICEREISLADVVICGYKRDFEKKGKIYDSEEAVFPYTRWGNFANFMEGFGELYSLIMINSPWNKIYLSDIIKQSNIRFPEEMKIYEDLEFNLEYLAYCNKFSIMDSCPYHYMIRGNASLTKVFRQNAYEIKVRAWESAMSFANGNLHFDKNMSFLKKEFFKMSNECIEDISLARGLSYRKKRDMCCEVINGLLAKGFLDSINCTRRQEKLLRCLYRKRLLNTMIAYFCTKNFLRKNWYWAFLRLR